MDILVSEEKEGNILFNDTLNTFLMVILCQSIVVR